MHTPGGVALAAQPPPLQPPGAQDAARQLAQREAVDALAHACTGVVVRRGYRAVVAAPVLDREVSIERHSQGETRQPLLETCVLVPELVGRVDAQARAGAGDVREHQHRPPGQLVRAHPPRAADQRDEVQGHGEPREHTVIVVVLQLRHDRFIRIVAVVADEEIEHRHQNVADHKRQAERDLPPCHQMRGDARERD